MNFVLMHTVSVGTECAVWAKGLARHAVHLLNSSEAGVSNNYSASLLGEYLVMTKP